MLNLDLQKANELLMEDDNEKGDIDLIQKRLGEHLH